jgi:hypothetical protein
MISRGISQISRKEQPTRFRKNQIWQGTADPTMRAEVIEISKDGWSATLRLLTNDRSTFQLNWGLALAGLRYWRPV